MAKTLNEILKPEGSDEGVPSFYLDDSPSIYTGTNATQKDDHWGYHLILDCSNCNHDVDNPKAVTKFLKDMVKVLKMKAVGEPWVKSFGSTKEGGRGTTGIQVIVTSSITFHSDDEEWAAYIDVFSCKKFQPDGAIKLIQKYFQPKHIGAMMLFRDASKIWPKK